MVLDLSQRWQVIEGDALAVLTALPDGVVQTCVTSPPYYGLRQYLFDKAVVVRYDLTNEQRSFVEAELARRGIRPRNGDGTIP